MSSRNGHLPDRWAGIQRPYTPEDVERLRGTVQVEHTLARLGAERLWRLLHSDSSAIIRPFKAGLVLGSAMTVGLLWPLTLAPVHWLNYRILQWKTWSYAGLLLFSNVVVTLLVLRAREGS